MRKLMWFVIGFAAASLLCASFYGEWVLVAAVIAMALTGILAFFSRKTALLKRPTVIALGCAIGLSWFLLYDGLFVLLPRAADGKTLYVAMEATDYSEKTDYGSSVEGLVVFNGNTHRVKAYLNENKNLKPGDVVQGTFRFRLTTEGGLDNPTNHRTEGIFLLAYPVGSMEYQEAENIPWYGFPAVWRRGILERIKEIFSGESGAFAAALLLGDRTDIDYELNTALKVSGISHIIAVSGLHVSILFGLIYSLAGKRRLISCLIGIPALFLFAAVAGFTPSITRACIMHALLLLAMMTDREYDPPSALAFAVLAMLVFNPMTVLSVSFQLSVGCMAGIFLFSEKLRRWLVSPHCLNAEKGAKNVKRLKNALASSVSISLSATVTTTPLVACYFGCVSIIGVITNLLTLWVISFIFYGIVLCLLISLLGVGIAAFFGSIVSIPIGFVLKTAAILSKVPVAAVYTVSPYVVAWLIGSYLMLVIFLLQRKKKPLLLFCCVTVCLLLSQFFAWMEPKRDDLRVTVLDVGQGQSILLQSDNKNFLVDCGGSYAEDAADVAAETLLSQGISRLDGVILTHYDDDHAGGVTYLLSRIKTDNLLLPPINEEDKIGEHLSNAAGSNTLYIRDDFVLTFGETKLTIIAPFSDESDNENSICVLFQRENCDILITGDRGYMGELMLLQKHSLPKLELLIAGHHGSAYSTNEKLLSATMPETVIISVGADNRYGHPSEKLLDRLVKYGCRVYRTDQCGTIIFRR